MSTIRDHHQHPLRLPVRSVGISKCVCKSWLDLLETDEFVNSHFAKSVPCLAMMMPEMESKWLNVFEYEDELDVESSSHDCLYNPFTKMEHNLFKCLPLEIIINILSRLPVRSVGISKCVCKSWLNLLETDEFVNSHFAKSVPCLAMMMPEMESKWLNVFEYEDELDVESSSHDRLYNPFTKFVFPHEAIIESSANGLLFLLNIDTNFECSEVFYVCNPVTREFIEIHCPKRHDPISQVCVFGFGTSKMGGEHKVIRILHPSKPQLGLLECCVYTIETGSWSSTVEAGISLNFSYCTSSAIVNGNLHWAVSDSDGKACVCCFDLEAKCFTTFDVPPHLQESEENIRELSVLSGCLCLSDNKCDDVMVIWLIKEYGAGKTWSKEYVISQNPDYVRDIYHVTVLPIKVFKNGDLLMLWDWEFLFYYSNKTKTTRQIGIFNARRGYMHSVLLTPSFLSLKRFGAENVISI